MQRTLQHLTATKEFVGIKDQEHSELVIKQFIEGCTKLDAGIIEKVIDEEDIFENKSKYLFLADMKELFDSFQNQQRTEIRISVIDSQCQGCSFGRPIKIFSVRGFGLTRQFAFMIYVEKGILKDIYQCNFFH
jgi:hypothetical protein